MRYFNNRGKQQLQSRLLNEKKAVSKAISGPEYTEYVESRPVAKHRNKKYYRGEHAGERVITDAEFDAIVASWRRNDQRGKIKLMNKLIKAYESKNSRHLLSNLEILTRCADVKEKVRIKKTKGVI